VKRMTIADTHEPSPVPNDRPAVWPLVIADMKARDAEGRRKYGTPLQPFNGRDALVDAYQEALDLVVYLRQAIEERNGEHAVCLCGCPPEDHEMDDCGESCMDESHACIRVAPAVRDLFAIAKAPKP
jgi:hypothetical protein